LQAVDLVATVHSITYIYSCRYSCDLRCVGIRSTARPLEELLIILK
jgi:hypothetical protein